MDTLLYTEINFLSLTQVKMHYLVIINTSRNGLNSEIKQMLALFFGIKAIKNVFNR